MTRGPDTSQLVGLQPYAYRFLDEPAHRVGAAATRLPPIAAGVGPRADREAL
ncbi:MAG: hypothetical protein ACRDMA_08475 [Solirubrobacterales bacterium]